MSRKCLLHVTKENEKYFKKVNTRFCSDEKAHAGRVIMRKREYRS